MDAGVVILFTVIDLGYMIYNDIKAACKKSKVELTKRANERRLRKQKRKCEKELKGELKSTTEPIEFSPLLPGSSSRVLCGSS
ncbi:fusA [Acrasis kona]|uniref:FusA n=1 Tax=Acrasis kona TaxID=1008807 RepID=A0AAW2ZM51_9EUKA